MKPATHTPLAEDRMAGLLYHLETALAPELTLTPLAVRRTDGVAALVIVRLEDGTRESLTPRDARLMARCLRDDAGEASGQQATWSAALTEAADAAERQADFMVLGSGFGLGVIQARPFGGR